MSNHPNRSQPKITLSYKSYRTACDRAFSDNIMNPSIFWNAEDGFYVAPSCNLVPNNDLCLGLAYYCLTNNSERSFTGSRREYRPVAIGIRKFFAIPESQRTHSLYEFVEQAQFDASYDYCQSAA